MTADDVKKRVLDEVGGQRGRTNLHGVDLLKCLVDPPRRRTYLDSFDANAPLELWLVLEEDPEGHNGYEIVFDEKEGFGLATARAQDVPVFIGWYGTFVETLEGM